MKEEEELLGIMLVIESTPYTAITEEMKRAWLIAHQEWLELRKSHDKKARTYH